jgi:hypothetical protein
MIRGVLRAPRRTEVYGAPSKTQTKPLPVIGDSCSGSFKGVVALASGATSDGTQGGGTPPFTRSFPVREQFRVDHGPDGRWPMTVIDEWIERSPLALVTFVDAD